MDGQALEQVRRAAFGVWNALPQAGHRRANPLSSRGGAAVTRGATGGATGGPSRRPSDFRAPAISERSS